MTNETTPANGAAPNGPIPEPVVQAAITAAFAEDLGLAGDLTTDAILGATWTASGVIAAREAGVVAGLAVAKAVFQYLDPAITFTARSAEGADVAAGTVVAELAGNARAMLSAERIALNFLGRMSGIATLTRTFVDAVAGTRAQIVDTRKTTPGLRAFEKFAVRAGGGMNHRVGLFDAVLIKDNHIALAGGIEPAVAAARGRVGHMVKIEVEVDTLDQLDALLALDVDAVLLDNMGPEMLAEAVRRIDGRMVSEASGGVTLETVRAIAESGVDLISIGALTHSARVLDVGLDCAVTKTS
jgi:nicotinate-nucleotide pyrophosphorylase (carboxylating)